jgi:acetoin utilization deacetylase AcuC-like enzyme
MVRVYSDRRMLDHHPEHEVRDEHPERPARLAAILDGLQSQPIEGVTLHAPREATALELERVHSREHVDRLLALAGRSGQLDPDTGHSEGSVLAAKLAAGAALDAVDAVLDGHCKRAFAAVRPPGHHAMPDRAMGFCLFSNLAIAAAQARARGIARVLVVDFDVHHGNGTEAAFWRDPSVLVFDTHQFPHYPGTGRLQDRGAGEGVGYTINVPMPMGFGTREFIEVYERLLVPVADAYRPELVMIAAGFDAHRDDPLGNLELDDVGYAALTQILVEIADRHASGRVVASLEGGYDLNALRGASRARLEVLVSPAGAGDVEAPASSPSAAVPTLREDEDTRLLHPDLGPIVAAVQRVSSEPWGAAFSQVDRPPLPT